MTSSCCSIDLNTGGLYLGWLGIIGCVFNITSILHYFVMDNLAAAFGVSILINLLVTMFEALWIYGAYEKKEYMMWPSLILSILLCVLTLIVIALEIVKFSSVLWTNNKEYSEINSKTLIVLFIRMLLAVLITYLTTVKYYQYKEIRAKNQRLQIMVRDSLQ